MGSKAVTWSIRVGAILLLLLFVLATYEYLPGLISTLGRLIGERGALAAVVYVVIMAAGIVVLPFSSLPLIPIAAAAWGVFWGGTLSILGWWVGSILAFLIARQFGRPAIARMLSESTLAKWEQRIPPHVGFFTVVLMRLVLPVEIPSYLLGLVPVVRFRSYVFGSAVGMAPFGYIMFAMGGAVAEGAWIRLSIIAVAAAVVTYLLYLLYRRVRSRATR